MWPSKTCKSAFLFVFFLLTSIVAKGDFVEELSRAIFQLIDLQERKALEGTPDSSYVYKTKTDGNGITQDMGAYFSASAVREADIVLKRLDTSGKKTVIFIVRHWFDYNKKGGRSKNRLEFDKELASKLQKVRKLAQEKLNMSQANVNILLCLHMMVQEPLTRAQTSQSSKYTWDIYKDELLLNYGLNDSCAKEVHTTINRAIRDKGSAYRFSKNKDEALKFRAKVLWEELKGCKKLDFTAKRPIKNIGVSNVLKKSLIGHEAKVKYVYNDMKGAKSRYCTEHKGHENIPEKKHNCDEKIHEGTGKNTEGKLGNPTIGIGHLIYGETELQKWCSKEPLSDVAIDVLFNDDLERVAAGPLKRAIIGSGSNAKLTQCQFDALISIVFNRGIGEEKSKKNPNGIGFRGSKVWKEFFKKGNFDGQNADEVEEIRELIEGDGSDEVVESRRKKEADLYFNCTY